MNRIEFMTQLAALLQDVPVEERREAMQYYNDYFDDAGEENEQQVIKELESPKKVSENIKADLKGSDTTGQGYGYQEEKRDAAYPARADQVQTEPAKKNNIWKILLILAIVLVCAPIVIPIVLAIVSLVVGVVICVFAGFASVVIAAIAIAIVGVFLIGFGISALFSNPPVGLGLFGTGLILIVLGAIGTVAGVRLCMVVFPCMVRAVVAICRKPFERKAVV